MSACGSDDQATDAPKTSFADGSTMARLAPQGTITVGTKFDQPIFGLVGPDGTPCRVQSRDRHDDLLRDGDPGGQDQLRRDSIGEPEPFIQDKRVDMVVATYTINDARKEVVGFAGPYYGTGQSQMVRADGTSINGPDDLAGKTDCSVDGSTPAANIAANFPDTTLVTFATYIDRLDPLRNTQVDAVTTDNVILGGYVAETPNDFKMAGEPFATEPYGIGLAKGDDAFRSWISDVLGASFTDGRWVAARDHALRPDRGVSPPKRRG